MPITLKLAAESAEFALKKAIFDWSNSLFSLSDRQKESTESGVFGLPGVVLVSVCAPRGYIIANFVPILLLALGGVFEIILIISRFQAATQRFA